jgi:hypothetical protein
LQQARSHRVDAAFVLTPLGTRPSATGTRFIENALEEEGIPVFSIHADMVDSRQWNAPAMRSSAAEFLNRLGRT